MSSERGYRVRYSEEAERARSGLAPRPRSMLRRYERALRKGPRMPGSMPLLLSDRDDMWRIRLPLSDWRIIFRVDEEERVIEIVRIGRRGNDFYRGYERTRLGNDPSP